jgi:flagellar hook-basal body complex protein FliE
MRYIILALMLLGYCLPAYAKGGGMQFWGNVAQNYSADQIQIGMSEWQVMNLGLRPDDTNTVTTTQGTVDAWCFNNLGRCVIFLNGSVAAIQDNSGGAAAVLGAVLNQSINNASQNNQAQTDSTQTEQTQQTQQPQDIWTPQYEKLDAELKAGLITRDQLEAGYRDITNQRIQSLSGQTS